MRAPNKREQDGDKLPLLCPECEKQFSVWENQFARNIFAPFHDCDQDRFSYGPWLHYFLTSLAWRTLVLDLPGLEADSSIVPALLSPLRASLHTMQNYLRGATQLGSLIRHHAIVFTAAHEASPTLAAVGPNVLIRRSTIGYPLIEKSQGYSAVVHNLAGFIAVLNIKGNPRDNWLNTKIHPNGGELKQPQNVTSWVMYDLLEALMAGKKAVSDGMSETQKAKIREVHPGKSFGSLRHLQRDAEIDQAEDC